MAYQTDETVTIETPLGQHELELEIEAIWQFADRDVGIMADYIEEFTVTAINGSTRHAKWVDRIISAKPELEQRIFDIIYDAR